jgi:hypothetical protein
MRKMEPETHGKTTNPMDKQQENKEKILRAMTGALFRPELPVHLFSSCSKLKLDFSIRKSTRWFSHNRL